MTPRMTNLNHETGGREPRAARLRAMWRWATGVLVLMAAGFVGCRLGIGRFPWLEWPGAFAEAALIGGLADWFAVVALFRHPFGIPIPHTSILCKRQAQVAKSLGDFVVENFLSGPVLRAKLEGIDFAGLAINWARAEAPLLAGKVAGFAPHFLESLDHGAIAEMIQERMERQIAAVPLAPIAGKLLEILTAGGKHEVLLDEALGLAERLLLENREAIEAGIREEIPLPDQLLLVLSLAELKRSIAGWVANKLVTRVQDFLGAASKDRSHPVRRRFTERVERLVQELKSSPEYLARGEELKRELVANAGLREYASSVWKELRVQLYEQLGAEGSLLRPSLQRAILGAVEALEKDPAIVAELNGWLRGAVLELAGAHRERVGQFIEETVVSWDGAQMSAKLELEVGADLQFVRINGAIVGGLVGLLIHALSRFLG